MTEEQRQAFADQYQQMFSRNRPKKDAYKFPETFEEQKAKAERAIREFNATEYEEWLRKKEENKKASVRRREAACELENEEQTDAEGCVRSD